MKKLFTKPVYFSFMFAIALAGISTAAEANKKSDNYSKNESAKMQSRSADMKSDESSAMVSHVELGFANNKATLSSSHKENLRSLIQQAKKEGDIDKVTVAVWSDKPLPKEGQELQQADRDLAANRAEAISSFLEDEMDVSVETYNMAERANWLARTFDTDEAELKSIFSRKGAAEPPVSNEEFAAIKKMGGPSEAIVVVKRESKMNP